MLVMIKKKGIKPREMSMFCVADATRLAVAPHCRKAASHVPI